MSEEYKEPLTDTGLPENAFRELAPMKSMFP